MTFYGPEISFENRKGKKERGFAFLSSGSTSKINTRSHSDFREIWRGIWRLFGLATLLLKDWAAQCMSFSRV